MQSICQNCGNEFRTYPSRIKANKDKYCSRACAYARPIPPWEPRFWKYVNKTDTCWLWTGALRFGYGVLNVRGRSDLTHRLSYELAHGPIPDNLCVLHHCDIPACVNPGHLFLGTRTDNAADKVAKGRQSRSGGASGEKNPSAKLTQADVDEIRSRFRPGGKAAEILAHEFKVNINTIWNIIKGATWKNP